MMFSVIYSLDVPKGYGIKSRRPTSRAWFQTEGDSEYEYDYLGGKWKGGKHRKWCAMLTRAQFDKFIDDAGLYSEDVETGGSLGAPGFDVGWAPAISFYGESDDTIQSAYVTPIPMPVRGSPETMTEGRMNRYWELVRKAVIRKYRSGGWGSRGLKRDNRKIA